MKPNSRGSLLIVAGALLVARSALAQPLPPSPPVLDREILIVPGDAQLMDVDRGSFRVKDYPSVVKRVIGALGDKFQTITVWLTFDDSGDLSGAFSRTVKSDVRGLGMRPMDDSARFGSNGTLRTMISMKGLGLRAGDSQEQWGAQTLPIWAQEYAHRWGMFLTVRDARSNTVSDVLLGRDCSHFARFVETQGSVMDGFAWVDNHDGTFSWKERAVRFANLDLYTMGLLHSDEVPPFFFIDQIPGYTVGACGPQYATMPFPTARTLSGHRVDVTIDDVVFANGHRAPSADEHEDSWREAVVVLTGLDETTDGPRARALADRLNHALPWWNTWLATATRHRLHNCTQVTADCEDPRADVSALAVAADRWTPAKPALSVDVAVKNDGSGDTPAAHLTVEALVGGQRIAGVDRDLGAIARDAEPKSTLSLPAVSVACGTEVLVRASTQTDLHYSRREQRVVVGTKASFSDGFEADSAWMVNPDGDDSAPAGAWERASPELAQLHGRNVQPGGARTGAMAFVTGAAAGGAEDVGFVASGRTTLQSPPISVAGLRVPSLRYAVSFAGGILGTSSLRFDPSPNAHLTVQMRSLRADGGAASDFVAVDRIDGTLTNGWTSRLVSLPASVMNGPKVRLRFVAEDEEPMNGALEVAIDDVEILSRGAECSQPDAGSDAACAGSSCTKPAGGGCSCGIGNRMEGSGFAWLWSVMGLGLALALIQRRRGLSNHASSSPNMSDGGVPRIVRSDVPSMGEPP